MCGIIGILGKEDVTERLVDGLARLEYRGYDSAGVAVVSSGDVTVRRAVGKLDALRVQLQAKPIAGHVGIGHTRWATHGAPTEENAHPHRSGPVTVVHNGIIENYAELRAELEADGHIFSSQTDTEVVSQLSARFCEAGDTAEVAVQNALARLKGAYALAFLFADAPDTLIVARFGSPLAIGYGGAEPDGTFEMFVGSDAIALAPFTSRISYLEDGDMAVLNRSRVIIRDNSGAEVTREIREIPIDALVVDKGPYRHFMAKEIHEQPESLARGLRGLVDHHSERLMPILDGVDFSTADRVILIACGTAHYACHIAKYWIESLASIPVEVEIASEYRYRDLALSGCEIAVFVSQSGETADTLAALKHLRGRVAHRIAVINAPTSSIAREADYILDIDAGPEIGVASTKAFTSQLLCLGAIAIRAGAVRGHLDALGEENLIRGLTALPRLVTDVLRIEGEIEDLAKEISSARDVLFLGRGAFFPLALEAALKLKEISYIHAEGYAAGELKHGPIALVDEAVPVVVFAPSDRHFDKTVSNAEEVVARGGILVLVSDQTVTVSGSSATRHSLKMPKASDTWAPIVYAVVAQLLAYHVAVFKGTDVDQPRNLAKSVTVE